MASGGELKTVLTETFKVAAAVLAGQLVKLTANEAEVTPTTATTDIPIGVAAEDQAIVGEGVKVILMGEAWVTAAGPVAIGARIFPTATAGRADDPLPAAGTVNSYIGIALSAASGNGVDFRAIIFPAVSFNQAVS